jgi:hypothetical protein
MNPKLVASHSATAAGAITLTALGRGLPGLVIAAVTLVATSTITALASHLFWLCALTQPARDLRRTRRDADTVDEREHLLTWLDEQRRAILAVRAQVEADPDGRAAMRALVRR